MFSHYLIIIIFYGNVLCYCMDAIELIWGQVHLYVCISLQLVSSVTGNKSCVSSIAESNVLQYLLLVLYMLPTCKSLYMTV